MDVLAISRLAIEGVLVTVISFILFVGSVYILLAAVFGRWMGYLLTATAMFGFMILLSLLWTFGSIAYGAPGTPPYRGPQGEPAHWVPVAAGTTLVSQEVPALDRYPAGPWQTAERAELAGEEEPLTTAIQEFLVEEADQQLRQAGIDGHVEPGTFEVTDLRFAEVDGREVAVARAFATTGGPEVLVAAYRNPGSTAVPSWLFLVGSIVGFVAHLPLLDRAERRRKEILTGGDQPAWRGPA